jgi:hypothetical protein
MYEVHSDPSRNLLLVIYREHVSCAEARQCREEVVRVLATIPPGFRLLTDLSGLDAMEYACAPEIQAMMDLFRQQGVTEVVRVVPDPKKDIGFTVMSYFHHARDTPVLTCETRAEALEKLSA